VDTSPAEATGFQIAGLSGLTVPFWKPNRT